MLGHYHIERPSQVAQWTSCRKHIYKNCENFKGGLIIMSHSLSIATQSYLEGELNFIFIKNLKLVILSQRNIFIFIKIWEAWFVMNHPYTQKTLEALTSDSNQLLWEVHLRLCLVYSCCNLHSTKFRHFACKIMKSKGAINMRIL